MRKVLIGTVLAAVGLLFWLMQRSADTDTGRKLPDAGLAKVAVPAPLPGLDGGIAERKPDALPPDAAIDVQFVRQRGTFGVPVQLVETALGPDLIGDYWKREKGPEPTWRSKRNVVVRLTVEDGKVSGGRVEFPKSAVTAELQAASSFITGNSCPLAPQGYEQADVSKGQQRAGSFECHGRTIHYKGEVSFEGGPGHPVWFEYAPDPL
jgi:hypothetical protein